MNISIITMHAMHNPGSVYQAYALQTYLNKMGQNVQIIDYRPHYFYTEGSGISLLLKKILFFRSYRATKKKYSDFISKNMFLTPRYNTYEELSSGSFNSDLYIVGSDQLWNSDYECGKDMAYYLRFINNGIKTSYSTSVGKEKIDEANARILEDNLFEFKKLSVREKSTSIQLATLLNKEVQWVCDPVFLLEYTDYKKFIADNSQKEKYVMVYNLPGSSQLDNLVQFYHNAGCKIILFGGYTKRCLCDEHIKKAGPEEFLTCLCNAHCIISSSFHATAFSLIFHKDFVTIVPERNGERIMSLLDEADLLHRAVLPENTINLDSLNEKIEWNTIDDNLSRYISASKDYLGRLIDSL